MELRWPFGDPGCVRRDFLVAWAVVGLVGMGLEVSRRHMPPQISFLQVGQGDCTVLQTDGYVMVVDAAGKTDGFDAGERLAVPELRRLAVDRIDLLVLTHPDADHVGGLAALTFHFRVGAVAVLAHFQGDLAMLGTLRHAGIDPARVHWVRDPVDLSFGVAQVRLTTAPASLVASDNDGSMLTRVRVGDGTAVLTGDASDAVEHWLHGRPGWQTQLLKAGHHGSRSSTSTEWLVQTSPQWVVFSCGRTNRYGHPTAEALQRASKMAKVLRTDRDGTLTFRLGEGGFHRLVNRQTP